PPPNACLASGSRWHYRRSRSLVVAGTTPPRRFTTKEKRDDEQPESTGQPTRQACPAGPGQNAQRRPGPAGQQPGQPGQQPAVQPGQQPAVPAPGPGPEPLTCGNGTGRRSPSGPLFFQDFPGFA